MTLVVERSRHPTDHAMQAISCLDRDYRVCIIVSKLSSALAKANVMINVCDQLRSLFPRRLMLASGEAHRGPFQYEETVQRFIHQYIFCMNAILLRPSSHVLWDKACTKILTSFRRSKQACVVADEVHRGHHKHQFFLTRPSVPDYGSKIVRSDNRRYRRRHVFIRRSICI
jgi:hypothetical protein